MLQHRFQLFEMTLSYLGEEERSVDDCLQAAVFGGPVEVGVLGEVSQTQRRDQVQNGGSCQAEVQSCSYLEIFVFATSTELVDEAVSSVVVGCSIAEVEAVKANAGCIVEVEVDKVLLTGTDHQVGTVRLTVTQ